MAGDVNNVAVWADADVLLGDLTATNPTGGAPFDTTTTGGWSFVGILDGGNGFVESQSNDSSDFTGWGMGVVATTRSNLAITRQFTAIEDNIETLGLRYNADGVTPGTGGDGYSGNLAARDLQKKFKIAFEVRTGDELKRVVSSNYAQIDSIGDATEGETALQSVQVTVKIYPDSSGNYWSTYKGAAA